MAAKEHSVRSEYEDLTVEYRNTSATTVNSTKNAKGRMMLLSRVLLVLQPCGNGEGHRDHNKREEIKTRRCLFSPIFQYKCEQGDIFSWRQLGKLVGCSRRKRKSSSYIFNVLK